MYFSDTRARTSSRVRAVRQSGGDLKHYGPLIAELTRCRDVAILTVEGAERLRPATEPLGDWPSPEQDPCRAFYRAVTHLESPVVIEDARRDPGLLEDFVDHTDHVTLIALPLRGQGGERLGLIVARNPEPVTLTARSRKLLELTCRQIAEHLEYRFVRREQDPLRLLAALEELREHDPDIASPTLFGFMRMAARQRPRPVERSSLLISGLAEEVDGIFALNAEGTRLMLAYRLDLLEYVADRSDSANAQAKPRLMARITVGNRTYDIGSIDDDSAAFVRLTAEQGWVKLWNRLDDGWRKIAAEVMAIAEDVTLDYIRMHMIHVTEENPRDEHEFDLYGMRWKVRTVESGTEVLFEGSDWKPITLPAQFAGREFRAQAAMALMVASPEVVRRVASSVDDWTHRLAHSVQVSPASES